MDSYRTFAAKSWNASQASKLRTVPLQISLKKKRTQWALTREEMNNCIWLRPEIVAQIEFTSWTPDGHLRHATFAGLRDDKEATDVIRETG